ncbi:hypothetical protein BD779DRAFT_176331 [Infundibulicybe gibba]|nr:hypothetical protein BD779DRAFT_176331 [Infundibulicybe gibba]
MAPSHSSNGAPIMHLPIDIIREIFLWCIPRPCHLPPKPAEPRMVLTHVCSAWRGVALATPELWADILIRVGSTSHVQYVADRPHSDLRPTISNDDLISQNLPRCQRLNVRLSKKAIQELLSLPSGTLPDLEDIEICVDGQPKIIGEFINRQQITVFQACPKLRRVILSSHAEDTDLRRLNLPWKQLSVLHFRHYAVSPIFCLNVLRECTSLGNCMFIIPTIHDSFDDLTALAKCPVYLPSLRTLRLSFHNFHHHAMFLTALHLPNLHSFWLSGQWVKGFQWSPSTLKSFEHLNTLYLGEIHGIVADELYNYLNPLQGLTMLQLPWMGISLVPSNTIFQGLASGTLCPRVTHIAFGPINVESLIDMIDGRLAVSLKTEEVSAFTSVDVRCLAPTDPGVVARVAELNAVGVEVSFRY